MLLMTMNTHYFLAIGLPEAARQQIEDKKAMLQAAFPFKKWVHPQDYHLTLAFLGNAPEEQRSELTAILDNALYNTEKFTLNIDKLGVFGNEASPRIFWLGVDENPSLFRLQENVYAYCKQAGFTLEKRPFHPHMTLARKWAGQERFQADRLALESPFTEEMVSFDVSQFSLFQTHLNKEPKYEAIYTKKL